ncbi:ATP-dependent Clp protease ATP-binding subunit [Patescibacteria group bacterium]|nr:ATP-dependent Clp protease ATP-binding subunit [Patescibacteria group bacterium]
MSLNLHTKVKENKLYPILILERVFSHKWRHKINNFIFSLIFLGIIFLIFPFVSEKFNLSNLDFLVYDQLRVIGVIFVLFGFWISISFLEFFFRSLYFKEQEKNPISFEVLKIFKKTRKDNLLKSFLLSESGLSVMSRCGIYKRDIKKFLSEKKEETFTEEIIFDSQNIFTIRDLAVYLYRNSKEFEDFLFKKSIREKQLIGSAEWIIREIELIKKNEQWWSPRRLERIPSIGVGFTQGVTYTLDKFSSVVSGYEGPTDKISTIKTKNIVNNIETVLSRGRELNVILVGEEGVGKIEALQDFARIITSKNVVPQLEHKKVVLFDSERFVSAMTEKSEFEQTFLNILIESIKAGNIILAIDKFSNFLLSAKKLGVEVLPLIDSYLASDQLQLIVLNDLDKFHKFLEQDPIIVRRFEKIIMEQPSLEDTMVVLEEVIRDLEYRNPIFFTYLSLEEIIVSADRYFSEGVMPDKAIDIAIELSSILVKKKKYIVEKEDVFDLVRSKTNIPVGEIKEEERDGLIAMEDMLHKRVIGQNNAIKAMSNAVRRARTGIQNSKRPIGSFLFIGPTGVGKTETAKALAEIFFKNEEAISRIDMSEYQGEDAVDKLIGSFDTGKMGLLSNILREKPYGVLLLDELEKASKGVHDLFLRIIDEGIFTDMNGKKVNARNVILIATSNAGSDLIWEMSQKNILYEDFEKQLVNTIIERGIFKPEFLNRFDAVVTFQSLKSDELKQIAVLMLKKLQKRLKERGIDLVINDVVTDFLMKKGSDPKFGARPMNRAIQDNIEQKVAEMLISGKVEVGSRVEFKEEDFI